MLTVEFSCRRRRAATTSSDTVQHLEKWKRFTKFLRFSRAATQAIARRWNLLSEILCRRESFALTLDEVSDSSTGEVPQNLLEFILSRQNAADERFQ